MKKQIRDYIDYDFHTPNTEEVRKFLKDNFKLSERIGEWEDDDEYITPTYTRHAFYTTNSEWGEFIPTEKFMFMIGMPKPSSNTFTKADLKDGMVCTTRNGNVYAVKGDRMYRDGGMYIQLDDIDDDLTISGENISDLDIVKVVSPVVVFERVDPKQQAIKKELEFAEAKKQRLENHINVLKSKLK